MNITKATVIDAERLYSGQIRPALGANASLALIVLLCIASCSRPPSLATEEKYSPKPSPTRFIPPAESSNKQRVGSQALMPEEPPPDLTDYVGPALQQAAKIVELLEAIERARCKEGPGPGDSIYCMTWEPDRDTKAR